MEQPVHKVLKKNNLIFDKYWSRVFTHKTSLHYTWQHDIYDVLCKTSLLDKLIRLTQIQRCHILLYSRINLGLVKMF